MASSSGGGGGGEGPSLEQMRSWSWFYASASAPSDSAPQGPFSIDDLADSYDIGDINDDTLVWCKAIQHWKRLADLEHLHRYVLNPTTNSAAEGGNADPDATVMQFIEQIDSVPVPNLPDSSSSDSSLMPPPLPPPRPTVRPVATQVVPLPTSIPTPPVASSSSPGEVHNVVLDQARGIYSCSDPDGVVYDYDPQTQTWAVSLNQPENESTTMAKPKRYRDQISADEAGEPLAKKKKEKRKKKQKTGESTTDEQKAPTNTSVYVMGLPLDVTEQELVQYFSKCGLIRIDPETERPKVKIYKDKENKLKGDALVTYAKAPSVDLAVQMLHETDFREDHRISVQSAVFERKEGQNTEKKKVSADKLKKVKKKQDSALAWVGTEELVPAGPRIVIIKHMFDPSDFTTDPLFGDELKKDLHTECSQLGFIERIHIFESHPEGVVSIRFRNANSAEECVKLMNRRWFDQRQLEAFFWDGVTDYRLTIKDTSTDRLDTFVDELEKGDTTTTGRKKPTEGNNELA